MIGLEYILSLYNMQHIELAEILGIKKQNINLWIKGKQNIPKKYLPLLEKRFGISSEYFTKELTEIDKLEIQKEKLKKDLKPVVKEYDKKFAIGIENEMVDVPIYDKEEINKIEGTIEKAKILEKIKNALDVIEENPYIETYKLIAEIMENAQQEVILHKTIEALAHYFEVLPEGVYSSDEQAEFESEIFEVFDDNNF